MHNFEIAWAFREIFTLMEVKGENSFKAIAYRKGADILEMLEQQVADLTPAELLAVPGLGKGLSANITEMLQTGEVQTLKELRQDVPLGIRQALNLPGVGTKVAHKLMTHLSIQTLEDLEQAAKAKLIRSIPGLGPKIEVNIQRGIARLKARAGNILLGEATQVAAALASVILKLPVKRVEVAGAVRRGEELVTLLELVIVPECPVQEIQHVLANHPWIAGELVSREIADQVILTAPLRMGIDLIIYLVTEQELLPAWLYQTGSPGHWERLAGLAKQQGFSLGPREFGPITGSSEEQQQFLAGHLGEAEESFIYSTLGLPFITPELRDDQGEIEAALQGQLPSLLHLTDLQGDLHLHSKWSDGVNTVPELVAAAQSRGYSYIAVTDHSKSLVIARGVPQARLSEQRQQLAELNHSLEGFKVFNGIELDILTDGRLDYPDEVLAEMELVIGSIHSGFQQTGDKLTNRLLGAIQNPHVNIIAHPTGRVLGRRDPYAVDVLAIIEAAAKYGTALEINASPDRLDLKAEHCRMAKKHGVKLAINTDAHEVSAMEDAQYGITVARKGWLTTEDIINTWPVEQLQEFLARKA